MNPSDDPSDDLHDAALWRALAHAPDQAAIPDWRLRKAILKKAHEAAGVLEPGSPEVRRRSWWWRVGFWGGGNDARMPWNAAFATVLVASLVILLMERQPVPGAGSDGAESKAVSSPSSARPGTPEQSGATASGPSTVRVPEFPVPAPTAEPSASPGTAPLAGAKPQPTPRRSPSPPPPVSAAPVVPQAGVTARLVPSDPLGARARRLEEESTARLSDLAPRPPAAATAPGGGADAARAESPSVRTDATEPPSFAALSQWTRITIAQRGGPSRSLTRDEARELNGLLGSAALSAVGAQPLAAAPEWRITLERKAETLAVFEIARGQVRWREGKEPPATGVPSAPALAALREALRTAVQQAQAEAPPARNP